MFEADEAEVERLLTPPLEPGPNHRLAFAWFVEWTSVSGHRPELAYVNPERTQYKEFFVAVGCQYKGSPGFTVPYIWVVPGLPQEAREGVDHQATPPEPGPRGSEGGGPS